MKSIPNYLILLSIILVVTSEREDKVLLFFILVMLIAFRSIFLTRKISKRKFDGQFRIQKNSPRTFYTKIILLLLFFVFYFFITDDLENNKYLNFGFIVLVFVFDEVDNFFKQKYKYDSLIIDNSTLILNGPSIIKRDLRELVMINSFDLGDYLILTFENARKVTIERSYYNKDELWDFINKMISFNPKNNVILTKGVLEKF